MASSSNSGNSSGAWVPPTAEELQKLLPQYEITSQLGRGGMGAVYKGRQISLDRSVAIKILSNALDEADASFAERFKNEARSMAKLAHPGIVGVYDFGETEGGLLYIVMEFIEGTDVSKMIAEQGRLPTAHALAITAHVCDALQFAHDRNIIHRDIKPANIMVGYDGVVKVADFGLAKTTAGGEAAGLTQSGMALGTLHYMAPEALMLGSSADHRADIYAVGVMLYQMLVGKVPHGMFELPSKQVADLDSRYDDIIAKAMKEDRELRYQQIAELRLDLDGILTQPVVKVEEHAEKAPAALPTQERPQRPAGQPYRPPQRAAQPAQSKSSGGGLVWAVVVGVVVLGMGAYVLVGGSGEGSAKPQKRVSPTTGESPAVASVVPKSGPAPVVPTSVPTAAKGAPFTNSLGMKFVPVPGTDVHFCIHETRYRDYAAYAADTKSVDDAWKDQAIDGIALGERSKDHPVLKVSWEDAQAFCQWLSRKESKSYRLPTDEEWSIAVGLEGKETRAKGATPQMLSLKETTHYPWSGSFPPKTGDKAGNFSDESRKTRANFGKMTEGKYLDGYDDGFPTTAPVMSFTPNRFGIYDMGGNVMEWCEDWFDSAQQRRTLRGASWLNGALYQLSSCRFFNVPGHRSYSQGFRVVVVPGAPATSPTASLPPASAPMAPAKTPAPPSTEPNTQDPVSPLLTNKGFQTRIGNYQAARAAQLGHLTTKYRKALDSALVEVTKSGNLAHVEAVQQAVARATTYAATIESLPSVKTVESLPLLPALDSNTPEELQKLRGIFDRETARIEGELRSALGQSLDALQVALVKGSDLELARSLDAYRDELDRTFPAPQQAIVSEKPQATASQTSASAAPTLQKPFINSLGMKFVPVPGADVIFCIHEVRYKDYAAYAGKARGVDGSWENQTFDGFKVTDRPEDHPVVNVSWEDAQNFCAWLSKGEGKTYRLPTDEEWSIAVGIGNDEEWKASTTPATVFKNTTEFPWGGDFPLQTNVPIGNYSDASLKAKAPNATNQYLEGYDDGFPTTAPVMSFQPNKVGLYDLGGNAWEWCEDWFDTDQHNRVMRGGCWGSGDRRSLLSSNRKRNAPRLRYFTFGFRCVMVPDPASKSVPAPVSVSLSPEPAAQPVKPAAPLAGKSDFTNSLGMKFVPVPGAEVLMCIHETRRQDYKAYEKAMPNVDSTWVKPIAMGNVVKQTDSHPVMNVSWDDAMAFCAWLSKEEERMYRLPTEHELDLAIVIHDDPASLSAGDLKKLVFNQWPWGVGDTSQPQDFANYKNGDKYPGTAPVMSFEPNKLGIYDLSGNVWEWADDLIGPTDPSRVLRGCGFMNFGAGYLRSGQRVVTRRDFRELGLDPSDRGSLRVAGFRVVINTKGSGAAPPP